QLEYEAVGACDRNRQVECLCAELIARHDMVDHAAAERIRSAQPAAGEQKFLRLAHAHLIGMIEELAAGYTEIRSGVVAKTRILGADDEVAHPHQHQAAR